jgi:hypothetical protein
MPSVTLYPTMPNYAAVGRVASKWAMLEHQIQSLIWGLAGLDEMTGTCITSQIGHSGRLMDALLALLKQKRFEEGPAASPLVKRGCWGQTENAQPDRTRSLVQRRRDDNRLSARTERRQNRRSEADRTGP